jgi:hypothetical protein
MNSGRHMAKRRGKKAGQPVVTLGLSSVMAWICGVAPQHAVISWRVVSTNYRMGRLDFFAFPALAQNHTRILRATWSDGPARGTEMGGSATSRAAIPQKVTIFVESAGGLGHGPFGHAAHAWIPPRSCNHPYRANSIPHPARHRSPAGGALCAIDRHQSVML